MKTSAIMRQDHEDLVLLSKRMKPEERLVAYFNHSQLIHQIYQAGVRYRAGLLPSSEKRPQQR